MALLSVIPAMVLAVGREYDRSLEVKESCVDRGSIDAGARRPLPDYTTD
jgi:hypothetical protein